MPIVYQTRINRQDLKLNPDVLYVFGDNDQRRGYGGLAAAVRGEPNAVGVRTKKAPTMAPGAFYSDSEKGKHVSAMAADLLPVEEHLQQGNIVVFPSSPLGSGFAKLEELAPETYHQLQVMVETLKKLYG